jgi:hypothetical protein
MNVSRRMIIRRMMMAAQGQKRVQVGKRGRVGLGRNWGREKE